MERETHCESPFPLSLFHDDFLTAHDIDTRCQIILPSAVLHHLLSSYATTLKVIHIARTKHALTIVLHALHIRRSRFEEQRHELRPARKRFVSDYLYYRVSISSADSPVYFIIVSIGNLSAFMLFAIS